MSYLNEIFQNKFGNVSGDIPSPCFILDEVKLINNLEILEKVAERSGASILLALKGFACYGTFPLVRKYLSGAAASSLHEAQLVNENMGVKAHTYCPAYVPAEMGKIVELSDRITFNSIAEWNTYAHIVKDAGISPGLRVNPGYSEIQMPIYDPAIPTSRLGIPDHVLNEGLPDGIEGLHFHVMCENDSKVLEKVLQAFENKFGHMIDSCKWINMGGGHLITQKEYNTDHLVWLIKSFKQRYEVEVILEPGAAIAWEAGWLGSTILDIVERGGKTTAILDSSFTCHMPDCLEMPYKPSVEGEAFTGKFEYSFGGLSCLAGDFVDGFKFDFPLERGDRVLFTDMMHYTMVKTTTFNGVKLPSIGILRTDSSFDIIRSFGYNDYKNRLS